MNKTSTSLLYTLFCLSVFMCLSETLIAAERVGSIELKLADSIEISKVAYTLDDVIIPESSRGWWPEKIRYAVLGVTPRPGYIAHLTRTRITARLEALSPGIQKRIRWQGASTVKVRSLGVTLSGNRLREVAGRYLNDKLANRFEKYSVVPVGEMQDLIVPKGRVDIEATLGENKHLSKRTCVWVEVNIAGAHYQTVPVWFNVESFQRVWVVSKDYDRYEHLDASVLLRVERDVASLTEAPLGGQVLLEDMRFKQAVDAGQVLTHSMVELIPAVEKGTLVTVHARSGRVRLRTKAIAMTDGDLTQRISVRNRNRVETYSAVVVGQGEVAVDAH